MRSVTPIRGMTLGLIGMGRIGRAVAIRARAFRMRVVAFDTVLQNEFDERHGIERLPLDDILACSDVVSLHVPLTARDPRHGQPRLPGQDASGFLPDQYVPRRTRRGDDLRDALSSGQLAGAGLDVFNHEPPEPGNPLLGLPNVVLSPHIAGTDTLSMREMAEQAATAIVDLYHNQWPTDCVVNSELREGWQW